MKTRAFVTAAVATVVLLAGACSTMSEVQRGERAFANQKHEAEFLAVRRWCNARGGMIVINGSGSLDRRGIPRRGDHYQCV